MNSMRKELKIVVDQNKALNYNNYRVYSFFIHGVWDQFLEGFDCCLQTTPVIGLPH